MKHSVLTLLRMVSPLALAALGGFVAATYPQIHLAFCSGGL